MPETTWNISTVSTTAAIIALMATAPAYARDAVADVTKVSDAFYAALNDMLGGTPVSGEIAPLWLDAPDVTAQHPIGGRDTGREAALGAFDGFASLASGGRVTLEDQAIAIFGDAAVETGVETGMVTLAGEELTLDYRVTNVYTLTEDGWRMVHHHTDLSPSAIDLLARLSE